MRPCAHCLCVPGHHDVLVDKCAVDRIHVAELGALLHGLQHEVFELPRGWEVPLVRAPPLAEQPEPVHVIFPCRGRHGHCGEGSHRDARSHHWEVRLPASTYMSCGLRGQTGVIGVRTKGEGALLEIIPDSVATQTQ